MFLDWGSTYNKQKNIKKRRKFYFIFFLFQLINQSIVRQIYRKMKKRIRNVVVLAFERNVAFWNEKKIEKILVFLFYANGQLAFVREFWSTNNIKTTTTLASTTKTIIKFGENKRRFFFYLFWNFFVVVVCASPIYPNHPLCFQIQSIIVAAFFYFN